MCDAAVQAVTQRLDEGRSEVVRVVEGARWVRSASVLA